MNLTRSQQLIERAQQVIPGGVNSPVRAFKHVGGIPPFLASAKGAYLYDVDGNRYIDYVNSWGPMILGHAYEPVVQALQEQVQHATSFGAPTELEVLMAEQIIRMVPRIDQVRMVNSGTEACMTAIRLARGYTGKNKIIKFEGCYHGHADSFLVSAGSGVATLDIQQVPGVPVAVAQDTLVAPYNNLQAVDALLEAYPGQIAAIIVEPVAGNMGCVPPLPGFLEGLQQRCKEQRILFILDEVMTGFRIAPGGAQEKFKLDADLITFGKIIGGGLPVGAVGGKKEIMSHLAPAGEVYQAGTLSGNPLAMIAGYTLLRELDLNRHIYESLEQKTQKLAEGLNTVFGKAGVVHQVPHVGSMLSVFFTEYPVHDFAAAKAASNELFRQFFHAMLNRGIYLPPSPFESWFVCHALSEDDIAATLQAAEDSIREIVPTIKL
ncbi:glutamate-1-semialdehyde 2,1-aminomutase [Thermoflavifilum thermophilum]|uniref:Glutamate-1-semialdehyde 2,1-aminomutase n=1 Tax=Thermoflavifilum thermophilum TaxID=1393122 RepID=A0A1I7MXW7_9BACT|nr:glutamate-1-semialdehyde 2,1-aminomutase [Thermoflavifilum thermophilum]SFV27166.1 glutamate-1-semialdehyde 2,1-aminomutase [Thermoflavifilum thermophilum]